MKIDTRKWRGFNIGSLFVKLDLKCRKADFNKSLDVSTERTGEFDLPLVNAKHFNNGIMYYGRSADFESAEMTLDIVKNGAIATGDVFAQPQRTGVLWDAYLVKPRMEVKSKYVLLFLAACLEKAIKDKFSYDDKCIWEKVSKLTILLPATADDLPDFGFMEEYMKTLERKVRSIVDLLAMTNSGGGKLDVSSWAFYKVGSLFEKLNLKFKKTTFEKAFDISTAKTETFDLPLVNAKHGGNGIMYYGRSDDFESAEMTLDIVEDGAASTGDVYAQPQRTGVLYNAYLIKPLFPCKSKFLLLFLATVIQRAIKTQFGYDNKCTWDKLKNKSIPLPALPDGTPDFVCMEKFMGTLAAKRSTPALSGFRTFVA